MTEKKEAVLLTYYAHVDNGGVTVRVVDTGKNINLVIDTQYFGYPGLEATLDVERLGPDWFEKMGLEFIKVAEKLREIDWEKRYE